MIFLFLQQNFKISAKSESKDLFEFEGLKHLEIQLILQVYAFLSQAVVHLESKIHDSARAHTLQSSNFSQCVLGENWLIRLSCWLVQQNTIFSVLLQNHFCELGSKIVFIFLIDIWSWATAMSFYGIWLRIIIILSFNHFSEQSFFFNVENVTFIKFICPEVYKGGSDFHWPVHKLKKKVYYWAPLLLFLLWICSLLFALIESMSILKLKTLNFELLAYISEHEFSWLFYKWR